MIAPLVVVETEATPNPAAYKFTVNRELTRSGVLEFTRPKSTSLKPTTNVNLKVQKEAENEALYIDEFNAQNESEVRFINELWKLPEVGQVYIAGNFITVLRADVPVNEPETWLILASLIREYVAKYLDRDELAALTTTFFTDDPDHPVAEWFRRVILPATEKDGGGLFPMGYKDGVLTIRAAGACRGCPYAQDTIKQGVLPRLNQEKISITRLHVV